MRPAGPNSRVMRTSRSTAPETWSLTDAQTAERTDWREYVKLLRFPYHCSFVGVLLGALLVTRHWPLVLVGRIFLLYLSFNLLLYGGLYTVNAITDASADRAHPGKRFRPVASGRLSPARAAWLAAALIGGGLTTGYAFFGSSLMPAYAAVILINFAYSFALREVPLADILMNAAAHPPRLWMGMRVAGAHSVSVDPLALVFLFAVGLLTARRSFELVHAGPSTRSVLSAYSQVGLSVMRVSAFLVIVLLWMVKESRSSIPYTVAVLGYVVFVFGADTLPPIKILFRRLWST